MKKLWMKSQIDVNVVWLSPSPIRTVSECSKTHRPQLIQKKMLISCDIELLNEVLERTWRIVLNNVCKFPIKYAERRHHLNPLISFLLPRQKICETGTKYTTNVKHSMQKVVPKSNWRKGFKRRAWIMKCKGYCRGEFGRTQYPRGTPFPHIFSPALFNNVELSCKLNERFVCQWSSKSISSSADPLRHLSNQQIRHKHNTA